MVEIGTELPLDGGGVVRPFARFGGSFYGGADSTLTAGFASLAPTVMMPINHDSAFADVAAGVDVLSAGGWQVRAYYQGHFSKNGHSNAATIKAGVNF